ncbi:MFS general substrate transporter [Macrolepiota fuliginosa MF-IS2]|uniref:MFS general substrate transporter n=1 Tax=Macrolepiota fuliginosa MF-IS2 TaxID=1400762 RepID=A0A9P5XDH7_9AGAR|nr:MFS general substrate transporter [Macrolepiota fuliginosa MF-IS2]
MLRSLGSLSKAGHPPMLPIDTEKARTSLSSNDEDVDSIKTDDLRSGIGITDHDDYPDGGLRAWTIVLGTVCCTIATGSLTAWGVFQSYYEVHTLKEYSPSQIWSAWIGSIQYCLCLLPGQVFGRLFDLGHLRVPFFLGSVLFVVSTFLIAHCHEYWHFLLCQGFAYGLACGICFGPIYGVLGHWFKKRRGLAIGLTQVGSSLGGTVFPIAVRHLIGIVGFPWTMRIMGFMLLFVLGIANIVLARRLPPKNMPGGLFNFKAFKSAPFSVYCVASLVAYLGIYTVLMFIDVSAINVGISPDFSFYLVSIVNASSGVGRLATGLMTDRYGSLNVIAPMTAIAGIMTFAWPYAQSKNSLVAVGIIYGLTSSAFVSGISLPLYSMGIIEDVGRRIGAAMVFAAFGALAGPPISGAANSATGGIKAVSYYAGSTVLLSVALMLTTRHLMSKKVTGNTGKL